MEQATADAAGAAHTLERVLAEVSGRALADAVETVPGVERVRALAQRLEPRRRDRPGRRRRRARDRGARPRGGSGCRGPARARRRRVRRDRSARRSSRRLVDHRARQLGVVRPRPAVEVVGADGQPDVVDDAHLGVHVDRACPRGSRGRTPRPGRDRRRAARRARARARCGSPRPRSRRRDRGSAGSRPRSAARGCGAAPSRSASVAASDQRYWSSRYTSRRARANALR